jgi:hypothetical protein
MACEACGLPMILCAEAHLRYHHFFRVFHREISQYLRSRKHLGMERNISFFDFIRAFASIR